MYPALRPVSAIIRNDITRPHSDPPLISTDTVLSIGLEDSPPYISTTMVTSISLEDFVIHILPRTRKISDLHHQLTTSSSSPRPPRREPFATTSYRDVTFLIYTTTICAKKTQWYSINIFHFSTHHYPQFMKIRIFLKL